MTLNEGQGINPGYTRSACSRSWRGRIAQRRPGYQPRLHLLSRVGMGCRDIRSTKARVSTPATPSHVPIAKEIIGLAQRRPGYQPRLHDRGRDGNPGRQSRSTKARVSTPATRPGAGQVAQSVAALNEGQGINPGYTFETFDIRYLVSSLNEGQGINPGYTPSNPITDPPLERAQRRPGYQPRLHC